MVSSRHGLPALERRVMKNMAKRLVRPLSDMTMFSRKALMRKGTMELPQVC